MGIEEQGAYSYEIREARELGGNFNTMVIEQDLYANTENIAELSKTIIDYIQSSEPQTPNIVFHFLPGAGLEVGTSINTLAQTPEFEEAFSLIARSNAWLVVINDSGQSALSMITSFNSQKFGVRLRFLGSKDEAMNFLHEMGGTPQGNRMAQDF